MSKPTDQIVRERIAATTEEQARDIAIACDKLVPHKQIAKAYAELTKEGYAPYEKARMVLAMTYDWFAYGN